MQKFFSILLLVILYSCNETAIQKNISKDKSLTIIAKHGTFPNTKVLTEKEQEIKIIEFEEQERINSVRLLKVLNRALKYAEQNKSKKSFRHHFEMMPDDTSFNVTAKLTFGNLFDGNRKHLLLKRESPWGYI